jgi:hypothetical protein
VIITFALVCLAVTGAAAIAERVPAIARLQRRAMAGLVTVAIGFLAVANASQLAAYGSAVNPPWLPRGEHPQFPRTDAGSAIQRHVRPDAAWPGRLLPVSVSRSDRGWPGWALADGTALVLDVDSAGGYDSVIPERVGRVVRLLEGRSRRLVQIPVTRPTNPRFRSHLVAWELAPRLGITHVYGTPTAPDDVRELWGSLRSPAALDLLYDGPDGRLWALPDAETGPYFPSRTLFADDIDEATRMLTADGWVDGTAVLETAPDGAPRAAGDGGGRIIAAARGTNGATITAEVTEPSWLVVPIAYDAGWSATIDGSRVEIVAANLAQLAVRLPAGRSEVELRFRPRGLELGLGISAAAALGSGAVIILDVRRRLRRSTTEQHAGT